MNRNILHTLGENCRLFIFTKQNKKETCGSSRVLLHQCAYSEGVSSPSVFFNNEQPLETDTYFDFPHSSSPLCSKVWQTDVSISSSSTELVYCQMFKTFLAPLNPWWSIDVLFPSCVVFPLTYFPPLEPQVMNFASTFSQILKLEVFQTDLNLKSIVWYFKFVYNILCRNKRMEFIYTLFDCN